MSHPIENILKTTMEQLKEMVDVNTIIGNPVTTGGDTVIVPVSRVCLGFLSGGGEYGKPQPVRRSGEEMGGEERHPFAGTSVAGLNLTPMAFLSIHKDEVKVLPAHYDCTLDRIIGMVPNAICQIEHIVKDACEQKRQNGERREQRETQSEWGEG